jgi:hypothetical protein
MFIQYFFGFVYVTVVKNADFGVIDAEGKVVEGLHAVSRAARPAKETLKYLVPMRLQGTMRGMDDLACGMLSFYYARKSTGQQCPDKHRHRFYPASQTHHPSSPLHPLSFRTRSCPLPPQKQHEALHTL